MPWSSKSAKWWPAALAAACLLVYAPTLATRGFIRDDRWLIADNPLLARGLRAVPEILTSGYVEPVDGAATPVHEFRPVLVLSYALQLATTGRAPWAFHLVNIALHAGVCALAWLLLRARLGDEAAAAASLLFAVLAVHAEDIAYITSRSELFAALFMLAAWRLLEARRKPRITEGAGLFTLALLSKEHAALFPLLLALDDWTISGELPWSRGRRGVYASLGLTLASVALIRLGLLHGLGAGGVPYFSSRLVAALTYSRFALARYLWPAVSGVGLCADYSRPLIPDASAASPTAWACLLLVAGGLAFSARALARRRPWAFWVCAPLLFLLPTCHLLVPLDTLGAERLLYMPTLGLCALAGLASARAEKTAAVPARLALAALVVWQSAMTLSRDRVWASELAYFSDAARCNPVSAKAQVGLGVALLEAGRRKEGLGALTESLRLRPGYAPALFDLAREAWSRGSAAEAFSIAQRAVRADPSMADAWLLLGVIVDQAGKPAQAQPYFERAAALAPGNPAARFNLARVELELGHSGPTRAELEAFLELAPDDPDAPWARETLAGLEKGR